MANRLAQLNDEMSHKTFISPDNPIGNALVSWAKGVKQRALNPLQTVADEAQRWRDMTPTEMATNINPAHGISSMAGIFAGKGAKTADLVMLNKAKEMQQAGIPDKEIHAVTGWTFGFPDGKPRFEIPDNTMTINLPAADKKGVQTADSPIGKLVSHPELFDAYPDLAHYRGEITQGPKIDESGSFSRSRLTRAPMIQASGQDAKLPTIHELQHAVQEIEGFARGGSPEMFNQADDSQLAKSALSPLDLYKNLAGESESRLSEQRAAMAPEQRAASYPTTMFDVPAESQIVRYRDAIAKTIPDIEPLYIDDRYDALINTAKQSLGVQ